MMRARVITVTVIIAVVIVLAACSARVSSKVEPTFTADLEKLISDLNATASALSSHAKGGGTDTNQRAGRTAINFAPEIVTSGGGLVTILALVLAALAVVLMRHRRRADRTLTSVIEGVERAHDSSQVPLIKEAIASKALEKGTADYLHRVVQRVTKARNKRR